MISAICGSPRKGNTEQMIKVILNSAKSNGAKTELILLREKKIEHCRGCSKCQETPYKCVIPDDMEEINHKLKESDILIFGSPTYFDNVSGLFKDFIDRTHPLYPQRALKNKKALVCCIGGGSIKTVGKAAEAIQNFCKIYKMEVMEKICITNEDVGGNAAKLRKLGEGLDENNRIY